MNEELLPCPFCGGPASELDGHYDFGGEWFETGCDNVGCPVLPSVKALSREHANESWNARADLASAQVAAAYEHTASLVKDTEDALADILTRLDEALDPGDGQLSMHTYGQTPDWFVHAANLAVYTANNIRARTPDDAKAALKAEQAKAHKDGQAAAFKKVTGHLTGNKPDQVGNHRAQGYYAGWMDALKAVREMAREDGE